MPLKTLIVDDEALARKLLADYVSKIPELELVSTCEDAICARSVLQQEQVDLMFLDIQMPEITGVAFLDSLDKQPLTIFTTAYEQYALKGYELNVIDYMLKPITFERFFAGVSKALDQFKLIQPPHEVEVPAAEKDYFFVKADYKIQKLRYDEILFVEGMREYVRIHLLDRRITVRQTMSHLEEVFPQDQFFRIHRSYIVNLQAIESIQANTVNIGKHELSISKGYKDAFLERIGRDQLF